ncbi:transcription elongation factor GreA [candidate division WWE3 bacterium RBG_19FT_COMBO_34_6]|uniref:Transcription elongation factor GreA n=1 Tax=candidate division WWE3 bacterium RBG_19FT_COMBO_34_6 TaxID=1802612 RepID=A0A1F4UJL7_UNCKA|nr:MAG: transcription elongation factor GreA [candidate division WWE3 bacterium RBG_19FT_COMBO_34_6]
MTDNNLYITKEGLKNLKDELKEFVEIKRPEIAQKIQAAREMGDISENAAYDDAKREQSFIEGKIAELEEIIKNSKLAADTVKDSVIVGSKVVVHIDGEEEEFHIVGTPEADPILRKISHESPLGSALLGKKIGDKVEIEAPIGKLTYTILKID